ncbi:MAG: M56 family metallopeptidase [Planctomycetia bacterium]|nr:M56 family metallopeptidase [Planctomycetia bacterium]
MAYWLLHNTVSAAILALVALLICHWRPAQPALRHALWLVVLAKLVAPPLPVWSFASPSGWNAIWSSMAPDLTSSDEITWRPSSHPDNTTVHEGLPLPGAPESFVVLNGVTQVLPPEHAHNHAAYAPVAWTELLTWNDWNRFLWRTWLAAIAGMAVYQFYRWRRFQALLATTNFAPDWLVDEVAAVAQEFRISAPDVCVLGVRCTPLVWVLGRVQLLWPEAMLAGFSAESRRTIIAHELAHLARRDHWVARFELAATVFWWWHPLFWYVRAMLHDAAEQACDARVTQLLPAARKAYAQALVEVCELLAKGITPGPALGIGSQTRRAFERRLTMIMREKIASRLSLGAVTGVGLLALVVLPGFTPAQNSPPAPSNPPIVTAEPAVPGLPATGAPAALPAPSIPGEPPRAPSAAAALLPPQPEPAVNAPTDPFAVPAPPLDPHAGYRPPAAMPVPTGVPSATANYYWTASDAAETAAEEVVHLTRATYRLPAELAEPFSQFLNGTLGDVVQANVQVTQTPSPSPNEGPQTVSRLIVTADEETQKIVGHFIGLLRTRGKANPLATASTRTMNVEFYGPTTKPGFDDLALPTAEEPATRYAPGHPVQATQKGGSVKHPEMDPFAASAEEKLRPVDPASARPARTLPEPPRE